MSAAAQPCQVTAADAQAPTAPRVLPSGDPDGSGQGASRPEVSTPNMAMASWRMA